MSGSCACNPFTCVVRGCIRGVDTNRDAGFGALVYIESKDLVEREADAFTEPVPEGDIEGCEDSGSAASANSREDFEEDICISEDGFTLQWRCVDKGCLPSLDGKACRFHCVFGDLAGGHFAVARDAIVGYFDNRICGACHCSAADTQWDALCEVERGKADFHA